ncbi:hypothetical protein [Porphyromonas phage phage019b_ATCC49417]|uniref:Uncharacterized protein n=1 Tax=Porphyromonas phage phage019a_ATCC49417 TaxID=3154109 RepID=A0AAT9JCU8_9VIRU
MFHLETLSIFASLAELIAPAAQAALSLRGRTGIEIFACVSKKGL